MATISKAQGGQDTSSGLNQDMIKKEGKPAGETTSGGDTMESAGSTSSGLSSIPGGKSRTSGTQGGTQEATEGWTEQLKDTASELVSRAQDVASDVAEKAQDFASNATDNVGTLIRRYPVQSLLIGFGIGAIVGMLLPSRR